MAIFEIPSITNDEKIDEFLQTISENVKRIRIQKGVNQFDLALTIG